MEINEAPQPNGRGRKKALPTLSEQIKADANRIEYATDKTGRSIGVRRLTPVDMFDITLVLGEHSSNQSALMQALNVCSVCEIDGDPVSRPGSVLQLKALMKRLDFHGMAAAQEALVRFAEETGEAGLEAAKN